MRVLSIRGMHHCATQRQSNRVSKNVQMLSLATAGAHHKMFRSNEIQSGAERIGWEDP